MRNLLLNFQMLTIKTKCYEFLTEKSFENFLDFHDFYNFDEFYQNLNFKLSYKITADLCLTFVLIALFTTYEEPCIKV